jgi:endonuclease/exonuclease/phosphatase family metal-dependent hydrolase
MKVNILVYSIILALIFSACVPIIYSTDTDPVSTGTTNNTTSISQTDTTTEVITSTATEPATMTPTYTITPSPTPILNLKVMTYNILLGGGVFPDVDNYGFSESRYEYLVERIKEADPDVLGIQEAMRWDEGEPTFAEEFANELGMNYYLAPAPGDLHLMLLTKFKITNTENYSQEIGRSALRTTVKVPDGGIFNFFIMHLDAYEYSIRKCQIKYLIPKMAPFLNERTIIMGDFNAVKDSPELQQLSNAGWIHIKHSSVGMCRNIDQIWISPSVDWKIISDWYQRDKTVPQISDHLPVSVDLGIYASDRSHIDLPATESIHYEKNIQVPDGIFEELKVYSFHNFTDPCDSIRWASWADGKVINGKYIITGKEYWDSGARFNKLFQEGEAVLLEFESSSDAEVNVIFDNQQEWKSEAYKRFGVSIRGNDFRSDIYQGASYIGGYNLNPGRFTSENPYQLLLGIGKEGKFVIALWDKNEIDNPMIYTRDLGKDWSNMDWSFNIQANKGQISIDNFAEILFTARRFNQILFEVP